MGTIELVVVRPGKGTTVWKNSLVYRDDEVIVSRFDFKGLEKPFTVDGQVMIDNGYSGTCVDFLDKTYEFLEVYNTQGVYMGLYCNINRIPEVDGNTVKVHDLFLDLWIFPDGREVVLDEDEFEDATESGFLTGDDIKTARDTLDLLRMMHRMGLIEKTLDDVHARWEKM